MYSWRATFPLFCIIQFVVHVNLCVCAFASAVGKALVSTEGIRNSWMFVYKKNIVCYKGARLVGTKLKKYLIGFYGSAKNNLMTINKLDREFHLQDFVNEYFEVEAWSGFCKYTQNFTLIYQTISIYHVEGVNEPNSKTSSGRYFLLLDRLSHTENDLF